MAMQLFAFLGSTCPYCNGEVSIVEGMVYEYTLDKCGIPNSLESEQYRVAGYCKNCEKELFIIPNIRGGYSTLPLTSESRMLLMSKIESKRISLLGNKLMKADDNPFIESDKEDDECPF